MPDRPHFDRKNQESLMSPGFSDHYMWGKGISNVLRRFYERSKISLRHNFCNDSKWTPLITPTIRGDHRWYSHGYCVIWPPTAYSASERPASLLPSSLIFSLRGDTSSRRRMISTTPSSSHPPSHYIAAALHPDPLLSPMQTSSPRLF